ncbi:amidohydrolase family protein [Halomarina halobia]|uniref:Amidohydrolase family protein n=1 Tax=Halomarina halobia TaxID=3033386 RepID=A0ABD6ACF8_9EURY|nr:amidohydrolase family protein [Halomarina sp. PSR21]
MRGAETTREAEAKRRAEKPGRLKGLEEIVDCDFHLTERQEDFLSYLPEPWSKVFGRRQGDDYGFLSSLYPSAGLVNPITTGKVQSDAVRSRDDVRRGMELIHSDRVVVTPTLNLYLGCVRNEDLAPALAHAYNEWVLDEILDAEEGIYGGAVVAPHRPDRAAEEIDDRANESAVAGVFLPMGGVFPLAGDEKYYPIYEAAEAADLPVMFHSASGNMMSAFPSPFRHLTRFLSAHVVAHPMIHMCTMADMLTRGVPVRFPELKFVVQEAGLGYVPYFMRRFDHEYHSKKEDAPMLEMEPSEYVRRNFYFTSQPVEGTGDPTYVQSIVRLMNGESNLLFSSDYPHLDFDYTDELMKLLPSFSDEEINNVYGRTALEVFDF